MDCVEGPFSGDRVLLGPGRPGTIHPGSLTFYARSGPRSSCGPVVTMGSSPVRRRRLPSFWGEETRSLSPIPHKFVFHCCRRLRLTRDRGVCLGDSEVEALCPRSQSGRLCTPLIPSLALGPNGHQWFVLPSSGQKTGGPGARSRMKSPDCTGVGRVRVVGSVLYDTIHRDTETEEG